MAWPILVNEDYDLFSLVLLERKESCTLFKSLFGCSELSSWLIRFLSLLESGRFIVSVFSSKEERAAQLLVLVI
jgi:hypothetical protein